MSRRIKTTGLLIAAVVLLSAAAAPAASAAEAPRWKVGGAFLGSGVKKAYLAELAGKATLSISLLANLVSEDCIITGTIVGSGPGVPGAVESSFLNCKEIEVEGAPACHVVMVTTEALDGNLGWMEETGESASLLLRPESSARLASVGIEECALEGEYLLSGEFAAGFLPVATEGNSAELLVGPVTTATHWFTPKAGAARPTMEVEDLVFGGRQATFTGKFSIGLEPVEKVGVFSG